MSKQSHVSELIDEVNQLAAKCTRLSFEVKRKDAVIEAARLTVKTDSLGLLEVKHLWALDAALIDFDADAVLGRQDNDE